MRYFGTDGVRGVANKELTVDIAFKIGSYLGSHYKKIIIGKDTRISSSMLESALACGISAYGGDVYILGYSSTPALAYNTIHFDFDVGVMISASHNPYYDNGIKIFSKTGLKIDSEIESKIEDYIDGIIKLDLALTDQIGQIYQYNEGNTQYAKWLYDNFYINIDQYKVAFDLANGGASYTFKEYLKYANYSNIVVVNDQPDGLNINVDCGSTHLASLIKTVKDNHCDLGFAFDGDADRVLAVDSKGNIIDGDILMYILSKDLKNNNRLKDNTLITTVMSNIGLYKALDKIEINSYKTAVGDKNVVSKMLDGNYSIGGEQSGHIIIASDGMFGDGLKTALHILKILATNNWKIEDTYQDLKIYPQLLVNKEVYDKNIIMNDKDVKELINEIESDLKDNGRLLVRPSGTEPLIRVMAEARDEKECEEIVYKVLSLLNEKGYLKEKI